MSCIIRVLRCRARRFPRVRLETSRRASCEELSQPPRADKEEEAAFPLGPTTSDSVNREPGETGLPEIYSQTDGWDAEYGTYHSPSWWRKQFLATGMLEVVECSQLDDGLVMWEDEMLHHGERAGWTSEWHSKAQWLVEQLLFSRDHSPSLTHYIATLEKK